MPLDGDSEPLGEPDDRLGAELSACERRGFKRLLVQARGCHARELTGGTQRVHVGDKLSERRPDAGTVVLGGIGARNREQFQQSLLVDQVK